MRFLADESCDFTLVRALREAGFDVHAVAEDSPQAEDKDFGQLFFAHQRTKPRGVVLLRYPASARDGLSQDIVRLAERHGKKLRVCFVVVQPGRVRITR